MMHHETEASGHLRTPAGRRAVVGRMIVALLSLMVLAPILVLAEPNDWFEFGRNHVATRAKTLSKAGVTYQANPELTSPMFRLSFATLLHEHPDWVPGGIFQESIAELVGGNELPVKMWRDPQAAPGHRVYLSVGDQTTDTGLTDDQARALIMWVDFGGHGLASLSRHPDQMDLPSPLKMGRLGVGYVDTRDGYDLLWCDTICSFNGVPKVGNNKRLALTIIDSAEPVTIDVRNGFKIQGGEPQVAYWQRDKQDNGGPGEVILYRSLDEATLAIGQQDFQALATLRRVFKWAPIARLAHKSDPNAFGALVAELREITPKRFTTPRFLIQYAR